MTSLFWMLADAAFAAGWAVMILLIWRAIFGKSTPRWLAVAMWAIVALRLVCPFSIESEFSKMPQPLSQTVATMQSETVTAPTVATPVQESDSALASMNDTPEISWEAIACGVWLLGMLGMVSYTLVSYARLQRSVRTATRCEKGVYECETVASPFILGVFAPRIYLPYDMTDDDRTHALAHERAHIARGDHLLKPLGFLLLSVYWFQPLLWVAYILFCRDIEFACDEKVIKMLSQEERKSYSRALLCASVNRRRVAMCPLAFGEVGVEARIKGIAKYKKPLIVSVVFAAVACGIYSLWMMTDPPAPAGTTLEGAYVNVTYEDKHVADADALLVEEGNRLSLRTASGMPLQMVIEHVDADDMRVSVRFSQSGKDGRRVDVYANQPTSVETGKDDGEVILQLQLPVTELIPDKKNITETVYISGDTLLTLYDKQYCLQAGEERVIGTYEKTDDTLTLTQDAHMTEYVFRADDDGWRYDDDMSYRHKRSTAITLADETAFTFAYTCEMTLVNQHYRFKMLNAKGERVYESYSSFGIRPVFAIEDGLIRIETSAPASNPRPQTVWLNMTTGELLPKHGE